MTNSSYKENNILATNFNQNNWAHQHDKDWVTDLFLMHKKYGFHEWMQEKVAAGEWETLKEYLRFRVNFLEEELNEIKAAIENNDAEEVVDGLIDLAVVDIGTLDVFGIDSRTAWDRVNNANMAKERGMKETRKNDYGAPDLVKPSGWVAPNHEGLHGIIGEIFANVKGS